MHSLEVTRYLYKNGYLSKTAAVRVLKTRQALIKEATERLTHNLLFEKQAVNIFRRLGKRVSKQKMPPVAKRPKVPVSRSAKNVLPLMALGGMIGLGSTIAQSGLQAISEASKNNQLSKSYNKMFQEYPELKDDRAKSTKMFNIMAKYAPDLATNPTIAGTWVKQISQFDAVAPENVTSLIQAQRGWDALRESRSPLATLFKKLPETRDVLKASVLAG